MDDIIIPVPDQPQGTMPPPDDVQVITEEEALGALEGGE